MPSRSPAWQDKEPAFLAGFDQRADKGIWFVPRITRRLDGAKDREEEVEGERGGWGRQELGRRPQLFPLTFLARVPSRVRSSGTVSVGNLLLALRAAQTRRIPFSGTRGVFYFYRTPVLRVESLLLLGIRNRMF